VPRARNTKSVVRQKEPMSDNKKVDPTSLTNEVLLADVMIRVTALEKLLLQKGIISLKELNDEVDRVAQQVTEAMLKSVQDLVPDMADKKDKN
jgi:hypothetical protein